MDKYLGKRLEGRYEIQELIGSGGMANVYKAYDIIDQRTVAVKILRDEYQGNSEFTRRFKNESKAIAVLSHPNIVRVYDVSFTGKVHSIVMEYIDGITLKEYIEQQGPLGWKEAVHFTLEILKALQHAHDKGIVHRDIKPQNIMLLQSGTIKVTDFGIARFARSEVQSITDRAIGSVHYISPEQAMGETTDEKSDLYSVGVMLFEMLTGTLPFEADSPVSVAIKQIQTQAVRPTSINPSIPEGLEEITMHAMCKNPKQRYQSAEEMIADIQNFKQNPSIQFSYKYQDTESGKAQEKKVKKAIAKTREDNMEVKRKRTPYIPILTGVTFAFVLASAGFIALMLYLNNPFKQVAEVEVPNLVNIKYDTARLQYQDIEIVVEESLPNSEYGVGVIYEQNPKAGRSVKENSVVRVWVSTGQSNMELPDFTNRDIAEVINKLEEMGLNVDQRSAFSSTVPEGSVIYTEPSRNSPVEIGDMVTVHVSRGPEELLTNVPELIGLTPDDAKGYLELNKLRLGEITYENSDSPDGTIIGQDPAPGGVQPEDSVVNVVVSRQVELEIIPLAVPVPMPEMDKVVTLRAMQDGEFIMEEERNPMEIATWRPRFEGVAGQKSTIRIYIDNSLYKEYILDFSEKTFMMSEDRAYNFD